MKRKTVLGLLIAAVLCGLLALAAQAPPSQEDNTPLACTPQNAYTKLMQSFGPSDADTISSYAYDYPDWYGGSYIDGDLLYVCLAGEDALARRAVQEACGETADAVRFCRVAYPLNRLLSLSEAIALSPPDGLISVGVDEIGNCVFVEVDSGCDAGASQILASLPAAFAQEPYSPQMLSVRTVEGGFEFF